MKVVRLSLKSRKLMTYFKIVVTFTVGSTCNHVVLMAQLYSQGVCHGMHAFILQIRSMKDHRTLPGMSLLSYLNLETKLYFGGM
jgi:hypothetical protein